jgi:predicted Zn-dependent peptidase
MTKLARSEQYFGRQITLDEMIAAVDAVGGDDVRRVAEELLVSDRVVLAAIGPFDQDPAVARDLEEAVRTHGDA